MVFFFAVIANATLFSVADGFLFTVLGKGSTRWLPSLYPLKVLCVYGAVRAGIEPVGNVIMSLGRTKLLLRANLLAAVLEIPLIPLVIPRWGLSGVAWLVCVAYSVQWVLYGPFLKRELGVDTLRLLKLGLPVLAAAVSGTVISRMIPLANPFSWGSIVLRSLAVCAVFVLVHEALTRGSITEEVSLLLKRNSPDVVINKPVKDTV